MRVTLATLVVICLAADSVWAGIFIPTHGYESSFLAKRGFRPRYRQMFGKRHMSAKHDEQVENAILQCAQQAELQRSRIAQVLSGVEGNSRADQIEALLRLFSEPGLILSSVVCRQLIR